MKHNYCVLKQLKTTRKHVKCKQIGTKVHCLDHIIRKTSEDTF